jgi:predicted flap endonuclease-1-like 5' DNA nuclease
VCFTPGLDLGSAKLLTECDILSVEELAEANAEKLGHALQRRGATPATLDRVEEWVEAASDGLERWRSTGYAKTWRRNRDERRQRIRDNAGRRGAKGERSRRDTDDTERRPRRDRAERSKGESRKSDEKSVRFYLDTTNDIESAPSIGPTRAEQLKSLGVETVAQLLAADPADLAERLDDSRVDAATVVAWQHQSGLMCRIPGLRGHDAQVLVGSGFTSAEEIAGMKPADLLQFVDPFCDTIEGQRALRGSVRPDLAEVTQWIQGARQRRAVEVA